MGLPFWIVFIPVFFLVRWFVLSDHNRSCGCKKYDRVKLLSLPNLLALMTAMAISILVAPR